MTWTFPWINSARSPAIGSPVLSDFSATSRKPVRSYRVLQQLPGRPFNDLLLRGAWSAGLPRPEPHPDQRFEGTTRSNSVLRLQFECVRCRSLQALSDDVPDCGDCSGSGIDFRLRTGYATILSLRKPKASIWASVLTA